MAEETGGGVTVPLRLCSPHEQSVDLGPGRAELHTRGTESELRAWGVTYVRARRPGQRTRR